MFWMVLVGIFTGVGILFLLIGGIIDKVAGNHHTWDSYDYDWIKSMGLVLLLAGLIFGVPSLGIYVSVRGDTNQFKLQSEYLSTHEVGDTVENAALTIKKIELNEWLFNAKYYRGKFGMFSFYPVEVLSLRPIQ